MQNASLLLTLKAKLRLKYVLLACKGNWKREVIVIDPKGTKTHLSIALPFKFNCYFDSKLNKNHPYPLQNCIGSTQNNAF
jgi:hypothetical protein